MSYILGSSCSVKPTCVVVSVLPALGCDANKSEDLFTKFIRQATIWQGGKMLHQLSTLLTDPDHAKD